MQLNQIFTEISALFFQEELVHIHTHSHSDLETAQYNQSDRLATELLHWSSLGG